MYKLETQVYDIPLVVHYTKDGMFLPQTLSSPPESPTMYIEGVYMTNGTAIRPLLSDHVIQRLYDAIDQYEYDKYREAMLSRYDEEPDEDPDVDMSTFANHDGTFADND